MPSPLVIRQDGEVWSFTLARPEKRNALSADLVDALLEGVQEAHRNGASVLAFRGEGRSFSAGFDFSDVDSQSEGDLLLRFVRIEMLLQAIANSPCVTVGMAQGRNFGAGVDLLAVCRQRYATNDASFRMPGLKFGLVLGTRRFGAIVGQAEARRILESSLTFDAEEAKRLGFVTEIREANNWDAAIDAARETAALLDHPSRMALHAALSPKQDEADLAALTLSAARAGLKKRIAQYLGQG